MLPVIASIVGVITTPLFSAWLLFMLFFPNSWSKFIDRESEFWICSGYFTKPFVEFIKKFEKGIASRVLAICGIILGLALIITPFLISR